MGKGYLGKRDVLVQLGVVVVDHRREVVREVVQPAGGDVEPLGVPDVPVAELGRVALRSDAFHGLRVDERGLDDLGVEGW